MVKTLVLLVILAIIAGIIWLFRGRGMKRLDRLGHRRKRAKQDDEYADLSVKEKALEKLRHSPQFWGVEIQQGGCDASIALAGKRFAFEDAPALPLEGCDARMCPCQYLGLKERRTHQRRKQEDRRDSLRYDPGKPERRQLKDRRRRYDQWKGR